MNLFEKFTYYPKSPEIRRSRLITKSLDEASEAFLRGEYLFLEIEPYKQSSGTSCFFAVLYAVMKAQKARHAEKLDITEADLISRARKKSLSDSNGLLDFLNNKKLKELDKFIFDNTGLELISMLHSGMEETEYVQKLRNALTERNILFINQVGKKTGHWLVLYGIAKQNDNSEEWLIMDPLNGNLQKLTTFELVSILVPSSDRLNKVIAFAQVLILAT